MQENYPFKTKARAEYSVNYKGHLIIFSTDHVDDLKVIDKLVSVLSNGKFETSLPEQSKQEPHVYFYLYFVPERLEMGLKEFMSEMTQYRGEKCLHSAMINCVSDRDQMMILTLKNAIKSDDHQLICEYSNDFKKFEKNLTGDGVKNAISYIDSVLLGLSKTKKDPITHSKSSHAEETSVKKKVLKLAVNQTPESALEEIKTKLREVANINTYRFNPSNKRLDITTKKIARLCNDSTLSAQEACEKIAAIVDKQVVPKDQQKGFLYNLIEYIRIILSKIGLGPYKISKQAHTDLYRNLQNSISMQEVLAM